MEQGISSKKGGNIMKKEIINRLISIITVSLFLITATTYVYLPNSKNLTSALAFLSHEKSFYMQDITEGVLLHNAIPTKDSVGLENDPYTFKVVNNTNHNITYKIVFKSDKAKVLESGMELLPNKYLRYSVSNSDDTNLEANTLSDDGILLTTTIPPHSEQVFNFRMWLDYNADDGAFDKIFVGSIAIEEIK